MNLSDLSKDLTGQKMFQIMDRARRLEAEGREIIHLEIGDPEFPSPLAALEACKAALDAEDTHYVGSYGLEDLRRIGADLTERSRGFRPDIDQIVVTAGANIQIYYVVACTVNPGEEVIILDPSFVSYEAIIRVVGGVTVKVPLHEKNGFEPNISVVESAITKKTRLLIVNSPHNPTGTVYSAETMKGLYDLAVKYDLFLLSDEVYGRMVFSDSKIPFFSPSIFDHCCERVVICHSLSKSYSMTGWRIGALTAPAFLARKIALLLETTSSCVSPFIQRGAIAALANSNAYAEKMVEEYKVRRNILVKALNDTPHISCRVPQGTFYAFANITKTGISSERFSELLLNDVGIATCPGNYFGPGGEGYVRFCFAQSKDKLNRATQLLVGFNGGA
jgi:aspartate aminotransferase